MFKKLKEKVMEYSNKIKEDNKTEEIEKNFAKLRETIKKIEEKLKEDRTPEFHLKFGITDIYWNICFLHEVSFVNIIIDGMNSLNLITPPRKYSLTEKAEFVRILSLLEDEVKGEIEEV